VPRLRSVLAIPAVLAAAACAAPAVPAPDPLEVLAALEERARAAGPRGEGFDLGDGVSPDEAVLAALSRNPGLRARRRALGIAEAEAAAAGLLENPELEAGWRRVEGVGGGIAEGAVEAAVSVLLPRPGERAARVAAGEAAFEEARAGLEAAERDLAAEVRSAHAAWRAAVEGTALAAAARESADRLAEWTRARLARGASPRFEALLAESDAAAAARDLAGAAAGAASAREEVARLLGLPPGSPLEPAPAAAAPAVPEEAAAVRGAVERRPELRAAKARLDRAEQELRLARLSRWPWPRVGPVYEREADGTDSLGLGIGISLPLFDSGATAVRAREAARDAALEEYEEAVHTVRAEAAAAVRDLRAAAEALRLEEEGVAAPLEEAVGLAGEGYRAGNLDLSALLAARDRWVRARFAVLERRLAVERAAAALLRATALDPAALRPGAAPEEEKP
jgi:cobalt-zinc-cadmium efflux system outer membrane protein